MIVRLEQDMVGHLLDLVESQVDDLEHVDPHVDVTESLERLERIRLRLTGETNWVNVYPVMVEDFDGLYVFEDEESASEFSTLSADSYGPESYAPVEQGETTVVGMEFVQKIRTEQE